MHSSEKQLQRVVALAARGALSPEERKQYSKSICRRLTEMPELMKAKTILAYAASDAEADLAAFAEWAEQTGKVLAFPISHSGGVMEARVPHDADSWVIGRYDLREPASDRSDYLAPQELDAVIVPCVAFDEAGRRLGHGSGYYDRYLPQCTHAALIAAAFEAQKLERVSITDLDTAMHAVVTEDRVYRF